MANALYSLCIYAHMDSGLRRNDEAELYLRDFFNSLLECRAG